MSQDVLDVFDGPDAFQITRHFPGSGLGRDSITWGSIQAGSSFAYGDA